MRKIILLLLLLVSSNLLYGQGRMPNIDNMKKAVAKRAAEYNKELQKQKETEQENSNRQSEANQRSNQQINETRQQAAFLDNNFQARDYMNGPSEADISSFSGVQKNAHRQERTSLLELEDEGADNYNSVSALSNKLEEKNDGFIIDNGGSWWDEAIRKGDIWQKNAKEIWEKQFGARRCRYKPNECLGQSRPLPNADAQRANRPQPQSAPQDTKTKKKDNIPGYKLEKPRRYMEIKKRNYTPLPESQYTSSTQQRTSTKARFAFDRDNNSNVNTQDIRVNDTDSRVDNQRSNKNKNNTTKKAAKRNVDINNQNGDQTRQVINTDNSGKTETKTSSQSPRPRNPKAAKINRKVSMSFAANQLPQRTNHGDNIDENIREMYGYKVMWFSGGPFEIEHKNGETIVYPVQYEVSSKSEAEMKRNGYNIVNK